MGNLTMEREVPGLGEIVGLRFEEHLEVEQYRGIPYATVPARFRQSVLADSWPDKKWDGTKFGPICPFPKMVIGMSLVQKPLPSLHGYVLDDLKCLNLNITCPKKEASGKGYPVLVWIHGGGNTVGSGANAEYDGAPLVNYSVEQGMPVVVVTINYRLRAFGFLASDEIRADNEAAGDEGVGNYAIRDQYTAYEWVKKNIAAFGGDPARITAMGHSAGAVDTHVLMVSEFASKVAFRQAILQSGAAPLNIRTMGQQQASFDKVVAFGKVDTKATAEEKVEALRKIPADELVKLYAARGSPMAPWQCTIDNYFLKNPPTYTNLASQTYPKNIERLLLGDTANEGLIFSHGFDAMKWDYQRLSALATSILGAEKAKAIFKTYGVSEGLTPQELRINGIHVITEAEWSQPVNAVAKSFKEGPVFYYHITATNPFDGPNKDTAHHGVDLLFVFLTYQAHLPAPLKALGEVVAKHWLTFANGGEPWTPYNHDTTGASKVMLYGPSGDAIEIDERQKKTFDSLRLCESMQDGISNLSMAMRGAKS